MTATPAGQPPTWALSGTAWTNEEQHTIQQAISQATDNTTPTSVLNALLEQFPLTRDSAPYVKRLHRTIINHPNATGDTLALVITPALDYAETPTSERAQNTWWPLITDARDALTQPQCPEHLLERAASSPDPFILAAVLQNTHCPEHIHVLAALNGGNQGMALFDLERNG